MQTIDLLQKWLFDNYIEIIATTTGLIYLYYSIKGNILLWFFGLITSLLYIYIFYKSKIYADMGINLYYVFISIYGWIHWKRNKNQGDLPYARIKWKERLLLLLITAIIFIIISGILYNYTDSDVVLIDAFTTAVSITATWMLARKLVENWLLWIVVDAVSAGLYVYKGLYPTVLLFVVYTIMAVSGYYQWNKKWKKQKIH